MMICSGFRANRYRRLAGFQHLHLLTPPGVEGRKAAKYAYFAAFFPIWIPLCDFEYPCRKFEYPNRWKIKLYWRFGHSTQPDRSIDTMLRSILLFFLLGKPAIQGVCPTGVFKTLCITGFFAFTEFERGIGTEHQFEYPLRNNKIVLWKITGFKEK